MPPMLRIQDPPKETKQEEVGVTLDGLAREGARRMLMTALEEEVSDYIERNAQERSEDGHALVVRNGRARARKVTMGCGTMEVEAPRVNDKREVDGERQRFTSDILPPYMRRSPKVSEVLPLLYLRGLSTNDFKPALKALLGEDASGLSSTAITRLTAKWQSDYDAFRKRDLSNEDYTYVWIDGIHFNVRLEDDRLCTLVVIGVRADGTKELLAVEDGYRESEESWSCVLRGLGRRGMKAPLLSIGDGALGFWAAVRNVWPETRHQLCWVHKLKNILDKLPKRLHGRAKLALKEVVKADTKEHAEEAIGQFETDFGAKYPKAVASLTDHQSELLTFYDFPAQHWEHIRTANPIESAFATVRLRQRVTKGAGSRLKALLMAYKLLDMASQRWRRVNAPGLVARLILGEKFVDGLNEEARNAA
jgi:putative transposase